MRQKAVDDSITEKAAAYNDLKNGDGRSWVDRIAGAVAIAVGGYGHQPHREPGGHAHELAIDREVGCNGCGGCRGGGSSRGPRVEVVAMAIRAGQLRRWRLADDPIFGPRPANGLTFRVADASGPGGYAKGFYEPPVPATFTSAEAAWMEANSELVAEPQRDGPPLGGVDVKGQDLDAQ